MDERPRGRGGRLRWLAVFVIALTSLGLSAAVPWARSGAEGPVIAERRAEIAHALDVQFALLKSAESDTAAAAIVARIWSLWLASGRPEVDVLMRNALASMQLGDPTRALEALDRIVVLAPEYAVGWNKRATVLWMLGRHERSLADIVQTLKREPRHFGALAGRGIILVQRGDDRGALEAYRAALAVNPWLGERHTLIPMLQRRLGEKGI
jgi:tetratricopeptide (TPR) repeat protein